MKISYRACAALVKAVPAFLAATRSVSISATDSVSSLHFCVDRGELSLVGQAAVLMLVHNVPDLDVARTAESFSVPVAIDGESDCVRLPDVS